MVLIILACLAVSTLVNDAHAIAKDSAVSWPEWLMLESCVAQELHGAEMDRIVRYANANGWSAEWTGCAALNPSSSILGVSTVETCREREMDAYFELVRLDIPELLTCDAYLQVQNQCAVGGERQFSRYLECSRNWLALAAAVEPDTFDTYFGPVEDRTQEQRGTAAEVCRTARHLDSPSAHDKVACLKDLVTELKAPAERPANEASQRAFKRLFAFVGEFKHTSMAWCSGTMSDPASQQECVDSNLEAFHEYQELSPPNSMIVPEYQSIQEQCFTASFPAMGEVLDCTRKRYMSYVLLEMVTMRRFAEPAPMSAHLMDASQ